MPDEKKEDYIAYIRNCNPELYKRLKVFAVENEMTMGEAFNKVLEEYFEYVNS